MRKHEDLPLPCICFSHNSKERVLNLEVSFVNFYTFFYTFKWRFLRNRYILSSFFLLYYIGATKMLCSSNHRSFNFLFHGSIYTEFPTSTFPISAHLCHASDDSARLENTSCRPQKHFDKSPSGKNKKKRSLECSLLVV